MVHARRWLILLVLFLVLLAGCDPAGEETQIVIPEALLGSRWSLETLAGQPLVPDTTITLIFDPTPEGSAGGSAGCNSYGAEVAAAGEEMLRFGEITLTAMACADASGETQNEVMDQEADYTEALNAARYYRVEGDTLTLLDENRQPLLGYIRQQIFQNEPADLIGTAWRLDRWDGDPVDPEIPYTIQFEEGAASGTAGCRSYQAETQASAQEIRFLSIEMDQSACSDSQTEAEQEGDFTTLMDAPWTYQLLADRLEVVTGRGETLTFVPSGEEGPAVEPTVWNLIEFVEGGQPIPVLPGSAITLAFEGNVVAEEGKLAGSAGCNRYSAHYRAESSGLVMQAPVSTKMFCAEPAGVMDQETRFLTVLMDVTGYALTTDNRLALSTSDGRELVFGVSSEP